MLWLWFGLILYAIILAPGKSGVEDPVLQAYLTGNFDKPDPLVTMVFSFLGIFPFLWTALYLRQDKYNIPAWPFAFFSFGLGAFSLLPYLFFKGKKEKSRPFAMKLGHVLSSSAVMVPLLLITLGFYVFGITAGSFRGYAEAFCQSKLVSVMTADFIVLTIYSYWWVKREAAGAEKLCLIPLAGALMAVAWSEKKNTSRN